MSDLATFTTEPSVGAPDAPVVAPCPTVAPTATLTIPAPPAVSVVIPCFNEARRIPALVTALRRWRPPFGEAEVVVVDDGSTDDTFELLRAASRDLDDHLTVRVERLVPNRGKGAAVRHGIRSAEGTYVVFLDADLSVDLDAIGPAISRLDSQGADVAFGSRRHPESVIPHQQPWLRQLGGRAINLWARMLGLTTSRDTQCGFKVMRRRAAANLFPLVRDDGFAFDVELLYAAERLRYPVIEVPVTWEHHDGSTVQPIRHGLAMAGALVGIRRRWRQR